MMRSILAAGLLLTAALVAFSPGAAAAPCSTDANAFDDDGVGATCAVPRSDTVCQVGVGGQRIEDAARAECFH